MKVAELLEARRDQWQELDHLCGTMENRRKRKIGAAGLSRFAALYRAACADLALAESHQLPPNTVAYLHRLVGRAHNQLYRARSFDFAAWRVELLERIPQRMFTDPALRMAFGIFWGLFLLSWYLGAEYPLPGGERVPFPGFAEQVLGEAGVEQFDKSFANWHKTPIEQRVLMSSIYIWNNAGIGLTVFAFGLAFGVGGMFATGFNAVYLGAVFGYMMRSTHGDNFFNFVTAHGPFELTAIVLSAAAGMHLGFAIISTDGLKRIDALRKAAVEAMPTMGAALILFFLAAFVEAFISPMNLPYVVKGAVAVLSSGMLLYYFVLLGQRETIEEEAAEDSEAEGPVLLPPTTRPAIRFESS
ncbi:MAG: stage II sporulation protein M [Planctomycetota bacterium]|nr:MAG: stage II sporulation protein M [Planctomycetota bacterium]